MSIGLKIPAVLIQAFHSCCELFSICTAFDLFTTCTSLSYLQESLQNNLIAMNKQTYPKTGTASTIFYNTAIIMIARRNNPKEQTSLKGMARASNLPDILTIDYKFWHTFLHVHVHVYPHWLTLFFWPSLQTRAMAWSSLAGFQSGSNMISLLAPIRLRPHPPALLLSIKMKSPP